MEIPVFVHEKVIGVIIISGRLFSVVLIAFL